MEEIIQKDLQPRAPSDLLEFNFKTNSAINACGWRKTSLNSCLLKNISLNRLCY